MIKENPFRLSKFQLTVRVLFLVGFGIALSVAGCGNPFGIACFIVAGMFGLVLAAKQNRDMNAASAHSAHAVRGPVDIYSHEATRTLGQPQSHATHSAESSKLELFGPPTDL